MLITFALAADDAKKHEDDTNAKSENILFPPQLPMGKTLLFEKIKKLFNQVEVQGNTKIPTLSDEEAESLMIVSRMKAVLGTSEVEDRFALERGFFERWGHVFKKAAKTKPIQMNVLEFVTPSSTSGDPFGTKLAVINSILKMVGEPHCSDILVEDPQKKAETPKKP